MFETLEESRFLDPIQTLIRLSREAKVKAQEECHQEKDGQAALLLEEEEEEEHRHRRPVGQILQLRQLLHRLLLLLHQQLVLHPAQGHLELLRPLLLLVLPQYLQKKRNRMIGLLTNSVVKFYDILNLPHLWLLQLTEASF